MSHKEFCIQEIPIPDGINLEFNELHNYDPSVEFSEESSMRYLSEDLFQATSDEGRLIIDMGWYGNLKNNDGEFKILVIYASDWDFPVLTLYAKSLIEVTEMLTKAMEHVVSNDFT